MFELPELVNLAKQINETLAGKRILRGQLGNCPHKFLWYNRTHEEFEALTNGKTVGDSWAEGKWLFIPLEPGYLLLLGEFGGKALYHPPGTALPKKYHLWLAFEDQSHFTAKTGMWGAMELYVRGEERERQYVKGMRTTPTESGFSFEYFSDLIHEAGQEKKRSAKALLTQDQLIPGLGNAIAQDILFRAQLHPRHPLQDLDREGKRDLYEALLDSVDLAIEGGGRYDEVDLFGTPGTYVRIMDKNAVGRPCPRCGGVVEKIQYLGGACYLCSHCQS
jgi:formamidopyrimidine-DNA glycosylase